MPNIAVALKEEIARVARKELRSETDSLKKTVSGYRSEIAALKRRLQALEKLTKKVPKAAPKHAPKEDQASVKHRFSAEKLAKHRASLGVSAAEYARLLGVSQLSVYKWEGGKARPRDSYLPVIAEVRKLGKREAGERLAA